MAKLQKSDPAEQAISRDRTVQDRAFKLLQVFGPVIAGTTGMNAKHYRDIAFKHAEDFVAECERREAAIIQSFEKTPAASVDAPAESAAIPATVS